MQEGSVSVLAKTMSLGNVVTELGRHMSSAALLMTVSRDYPSFEYTEVMQTL